MAETANIGKMAELLSKEIFSAFGWHLKGFKNYSWPCALSEQHRKKRVKKTHPTDAVFRYFDPYTNQTTYVITDLKSYSKGTIQSFDAGAALKSLGETVECAQVSPDWKNQYVDPTENAQVLGMLFIFNHDRELDTDFFKILETSTAGKIDIPKQQRIYVFSPERIVLLNSVAKDIFSLRGSGMLPGSTECWFIFPDLVRHKSFDSMAKAATIEQLLAPWILLSYRAKNLNPGGKLAYWLDRGMEVDDFKYFFDYLFRYQMVSEVERIQVRAIKPTPNAFANFETAKYQYARDYWPIAGGSEAQSKDRMEVITFEAVTSIVDCFSEEAVGFRDV